jgi:hypothetical protein
VKLLRTYWTKPRDEEEDKKPPEKDWWGGNRKTKDTNMTGSIKQRG